MNNKKIRTGIVGGGGYTAGELIRLLSFHPGAELAFVQSASQAGKPVGSTHRDCAPFCALDFQAEIGEAEVYFLCVGHGKAKAFLQEHPLPKEALVIDLSTDFRHKDPGHDFVYGLPELNRHLISTAKRVANPGCFATCIQLALLPLAHASALRHPVHVSAITGSTGAGQSLSASTHFTWREGNISNYKTLDHQHLKEINQSLSQLYKPWGEELFFIPYRGNFTRGILATSYTRSELSLEEVKEIYQEFYAHHPFVHISEQPIDLKLVVNTNYCAVHLEKKGEQLILTTCLDNLLKGASGQAVQNMNLALGLIESSGLDLKPSAF